MSPLHQQELLRVAKETLQWFTNRAGGTGLNPPHRDVDLARELYRVIRRIELDEAVDALEAERQQQKQGAA